MAREPTESQSRSDAQSQQQPRTDVHAQHQPDAPPPVQPQPAGLLGALSANLIPLCLVGAMIILTYTGISNTPLVMAVCILVCLAGLLEGRARVDLWVFVPLVLYVALGFVLSFAHHGTVMYAYECVQLAFPIVYLAVACLNPQQLRLVHTLVVGWMALLALIAIILFTIRVFGGTVTRLAWPITSANANGILFVIAWFASLGLAGRRNGSLGFPSGDARTVPGGGIPASEKAEPSPANARLESAVVAVAPALLVGLGLTMSLGAFLALLVGLAIYLVSLRREHSARNIVRIAASLIIRVALAVGIGIQMYAAAAWGDAPWLCVAYILLTVGLLALWRPFGAFIASHGKAAVVLIVLAAALAVAAVAVRPSALATFAERIHMMQNGLGYIAQNPLAGIGPYEWRHANIADADTYFNTWHIHNVPIHIAAELGIPAALLLIVIVIRFFGKRVRVLGWPNVSKTDAARKGDDERTHEGETLATGEGPAARSNDPAIPAECSGFGAFVAHSLIDTGFFFTGITTLAILTTARPHLGGTGVDSAVTRLCFGVLGVAASAVLALAVTAGGVS